MENLQKFLANDDARSRLEEAGIVWKQAYQWLNKPPGYVSHHYRIRLSKAMRIPLDKIPLLWKKPLEQIPQERVGRRPDAPVWNPEMQRVQDEHPELFEGWTHEDFERFHMARATGGAMTFEAAIEHAKKINLCRHLRPVVDRILDHPETPFEHVQALAVVVKLMHPGLLAHLD